MKSIKCFKAEDFNDVIEFPGVQTLLNELLLIDNSKFILKRNKK